MNRNKIILITIFFLALVWSFISPVTWDTWLMEVTPGLFYITALAIMFRSFKFTDFTLIFILIHCIILFIGAKYTYAEVPLFNWIRDYFEMDRNNYDKLGHFAQGFIPAMVARELIIRLGAVKRWLNFFVISICLAISALYEIFEWFAAVAMADGAEDFLGTQGYVWDAQSDMLFALMGASCMLLLLSKIQDKYISGLLTKA